MNIRLFDSIRTKLFLILFLILMTNIILNIVLGSAFFEQLYTSNINAELKEGIAEIKSAYNEHGDYNKVIYEIENKNVLVCIFLLKGENIDMKYATRLNGGGVNRPDRGLFGRIAEFKDKADHSKLINTNEIYYADKNRDLKINTITVIAHLNGDLFLLLETPRTYIAEIALFAMKYMVYIAIFTLFIGIIIVFFVAGKISKPLRNIQAVANKISRLDFSEKCPIGTKDEVGLLAQDINNMSVALQDNITRLVNANEVLKSDLERQEQTDKMRKQFIANVSHDFKTPLTLIVSYAEALKDISKMNETEKSEYLSIIISEGYRMSSLVQQLLKLSQLESGMVKIEKTIFSINQMIDDVINTHKIILESKNIHVIKETTNYLAVNADYQRIEQVVNNLFENAVKYSDGEVKISLKMQGDKCLVSVFNSGNQIDEQDMENLFISFYRADKSRNSDRHSYGLGLAIVKLIMDMHEEAFGVYNCEDGVVFWFELEMVDFD